MTNQTPSQTPGRNDPAREEESVKKEGAWKSLISGVLSGLVHNWPFKLLALFLAVCLWATLITSNPNLTRDQVYNDVNVTISNGEVLKRNGLIVVTDLSEGRRVNLRVAVPQGQVGNVQTSTFNPRVDLSRITRAGTQEVRIQTTNSALYGTVQDVQPAYLTVEVDEYVTRYRIPVNLDVVGEAPEGYYVGTATSDPQLVTVSGPASLVGRIVRADAVLDRGAVKARPGATRMSVPFTLIDDQGEAVESRLIEVTSESVLLDSIIVDLTVYPEKVLHLSELGLITGEPAPGYEIRSVTITPDTFVAAGNQRQLDALDVLYADAQIDVTGLTESVNKQLKVRRPSELVYLSQETVTVAVEIGPVIRTRTFEKTPIRPVNLTEGLRVTSVNETATVTVEGPQLWLETLKPEDISLTVNLTGLGEGVYSVPLVCTIPGADPAARITVAPYAIDVMLTEAR